MSKARAERFSCYKIVYIVDLIIQSWNISRLCSRLCFCFRLPFAFFSYSFPPTPVSRCSCRLRALALNNPSHPYPNLLDRGKAWPCEGFLHIHTIYWSIRGQYGSSSHFFDDGQKAELEQYQPLQLLVVSSQLVLQSAVPFSCTLIDPAAKE